MYYNSPQFMFFIDIANLEAWGLVVLLSTLHDTNITRTIVLEVKERIRSGQNLASKWLAILAQPFIS
ncbi:hypothetical protein Ciccas_001099 [Cichlidogyrus casuarinus]|uniref:Uncharacterized protein n=1 Tax=Cichlidogyrus casuarinus TaxID=1844966 RepID=A0ABD2QKZ2_9PLAT